MNLLNFFLPFLDWLAKKLCFHEKLVRMFVPLMVALPTMVYIGGEFSLVDSYVQFYIGFSFGLVVKSNKPLSDLSWYNQ